MKPKINLADPIIKLAMQELKSQYILALDAPNKAERAVLPIYGSFPRKSHVGGNSKTQQIGSGVLVNIENEYFIFGATHVFSELGENQIITGSGQGLINILGGERFSSGRLPSLQIDKYDASVFHIQSEVPDELKHLAITLEDCDFSLSNTGNPVYLITGFRVKKSNINQNTLSSKQEAFPSIEYSKSDYSRCAIDRVSHIMLAYEDQHLTNDGWKTSPSPRGMSGGGILRIDGTDVVSQRHRKSNLNQKLCAITIEHHRKNKQQGYLVGTRINVHLALVNKFMPELLKNFLQGED